MNRIILNTRTETPAYFDMTSQHPPAGCNWSYGYGFRMGDRAVAYIRCLQWRKENQDGKLVILEDNHVQGTSVSKNLSAEWIFRDVADEVWSATYPEEKLPDPVGTALYDQNLWMYWYNSRNLDVTPSIKPEANVDDIIKRLNIPDDFVTVQPLIDASYNSYRNGTSEWWYSLIGWMTNSLNVVVLGEHRLAMQCPRNAYPVYAYGVTPMESLALISRARIHVGGETGTTLWAPILRTPTVGLYTPLDPWPNWCTEPLGFGCPVQISRLGGRTDKVAMEIVSFYGRQKS